MTKTAEVENKPLSNKDDKKPTNDTDEEDFPFKPLVTSTPKKHNSIVSVQDCDAPGPSPSVILDRSLSNASIATSGRLKNHCNVSNSTISTFNYNFQVSQRNSANIIDPLLCTHIPNFEKSWSNDHDSTLEEFPRDDQEKDVYFSFQKISQGNRSQEWDDCFNRRTGHQYETSRQKLPTKRKKNKKRKNNEKVAIKNVKKLVLYVNNY